MYFSPNSFFKELHVERIKTNTDYKKIEIKNTLKEQNREHSRKGKKEKEKIKSM